jgi:hypothetical protein
LQRISYKEYIPASKWLTEARRSTVLPAPGARHFGFIALPAAQSSNPYMAV